MKCAEGVEHRSFPKGEEEMLHFELCSCLETQKGRPQGWSGVYGLQKAKLWLERVFSASSFVNHIMKEPIMSFLFYPTVAKPSET